LEYIVGEGNFLVIKLNMSDTLAYRKLMAQGIMVRSMTGFRFPNHIRISINKLYIMELFIKALENIL
jgi:histidinol-phosphate aminotransferase